MWSHMLCNVTFTVLLLIPFHRLSKSEIVRECLTFEGRWKLPQWHRQSTWLQSEETQKWGRQNRNSSWSTQPNFFQGLSCWFQCIPCLYRWLLIQPFQEEKSYELKQGWQCRGLLSYTGGCKLMDHQTLRGPSGFCWIFCTVNYPRKWTSAELENKDICLLSM